MKYCPLLALPLALALAWPSGGEVPATSTRRVTLHGQTFTLPAGFTIERVAGSPLVDRPITAAFDEQGRLYVADSSGSNEMVTVQLEKKPHRVVRLEDADGDGVFDKSVVFADRLMFPEGTMWLDGSLYVAAPPSIWKLTDTDNDGVADRREEWFDGKTLTGCANDLHGPYLGPDGWVYWCKGAFAEQTYARPDKQPFVTRAAHIFRARPDGTGLEPVMTGGMDNPVDVTFTPGGERVFTTTFFQFPAGGRRDGLVHAVYGGVYGKDWEVIRQPAHAWTGPDVLPVLTHLGPAAPAGLTRYEARAFGPDYQDNLFAALFNLQKVTRHVLEPNGATFRTRDHDFVVSDSKDFHPTDVIEDADGSLLIVDTGGWYKLCCPTSQLVKPDVLGGIYRVRRANAPRLADARGLKLDWPKLSANELAKLLDDARPAMRQRAVQSLAQHDDALPALEALLQAKPSVAGRRNVVWAATRLDQPEARAIVRKLLRDPDETVRQAAAHSVSVRRDQGAVFDLVWLLEKGTAQNQRAAAEALGRVGGRFVVPLLLSATERALLDRMLEHSLIYALIEINDPAATAAGLKSPLAASRRAALIALDQMPGGKLPEAAVLAELNAADVRLRDAAWWVASRHPEWGASLSKVLRDRLGDEKLPPAERDDLALQLAKLASAPAIQTLLTERLRDATAPAPARLVVLRALAQAKLKETPADWLAALADALKSGDAAVTREAVVAARSLRLPKQPPAPFVAALRQTGSNAELPADTRLHALAALPGGLAKVEPGTFAFLQETLRPTEPVARRTLAADVLSQANLNAEQLTALADAFKTAGPLEANRLLDAFARSNDEQVGRRLLDALKQSPAKTGLRVEALQRVFAKYSPAVRQQAEALYDSLRADTAQQRTRLDQLVKSLPEGDVRRGQAVFNSPKAACAACHAIGYLGGKIGPDLTRIGSVRTERDLLEAIVFPNASFVRGYEPVVVATADGKIHNGLLRSEVGAEVVLTTGTNQEVRLARDEIEDVQPSAVSVMPAGLDQQLTPRELADLVAFLKACR